MTIGQAVALLRGMQKWLAEPYATAINVVLARLLEV